MMVPALLVYAFKCFPSFLILMKISKRKWKQTFAAPLRELSSFDNELQTLWSGASHLCRSENFGKKYEKLNKHLERFNRKLISSKERNQSIILS